MYVNFGVAVVAVLLKNQWTLIIKQTTGQMPQQGIDKIWLMRLFRDQTYVPRGRGRGRPRGFYRGRGMAYTDVREMEPK